MASNIDAENQADILGINQIQLLLAEKRTSLSVLRTGIALLALPLSIFSVLIATSEYYDRADAVWMLVAAWLVNLSLIALGIYLIVRSLRRMRQYSREIEAIKQQHQSLRQLVD